MYEPTNEMGVIVLFTQLCVNSIWEILSIKSSFPDAKIRNKTDAKIYQVEFEFLSSNFISHKHSIFNCDIIICWRNNINKNIPINIWELSNYNPIIKEYLFSEKEQFNLKTDLQSCLVNNEDKRLLDENYEDNWRIISSKLSDKEIHDIAYVLNIKQISEKYYLPPNDDNIAKRWRIYAERELERFNYKKYLYK